MARLAHRDLRRFDIQPFRPVVQLQQRRALPHVVAGAEQHAGDAARGLRKKLGRSCRAGRADGFHLRHLGNKAHLLRDDRHFLGRSLVLRTGAGSEQQADADEHEYSEIKPGHRLPVYGSRCVGERLFGFAALLPTPDTAQGAKEPIRNGSN